MPDLDAMVDRLSVDVPELLAKHGIPGAAIGICDRDKVLWTQGFGTTRGAGGGRPVTPQTMFSLQSVSKLYTATTIMLTVQDGQLDLDEPITTYLPDFTVNSAWEQRPERRITLRHLLSHTAGFTHEAPIGGNYLPGRSWTAHCRSISDTWLRFPVGHHYEYSNLGVDLAAYALQTVTGQPFHTYARTRLFEPLGLARTTFDQRRISAEPDRAIGHDPTVKRVPVWIPIIASGGLYASVADVCRFVQFQLRAGEQLLDSALVSTMYEVPFPEPVQDLGYGLGVIDLRWDGRLVRGHSGGGFGFSCNVIWAPDDSLGVVILTNSDTFQPSIAVPQCIFRDLLGVLEDPRPAAPATAAQPFDGSYVGRGGSRPSGDDQHARYRLDGRYLIRNDGFTYYHNVLPEFSADNQPDGVWNRSYNVRIAGALVERVRLLRHGDSTAIELGGGAYRLPLTRHDDRLYFCSMGEALDLSRTPITYANIPLRHT